MSLPKFDDLPPPVLPQIPKSVEFRGGEYAVFMKTSFVNKMKIFLPHFRFLKMGEARWGLYGKT